MNEQVKNWFDGTTSVVACCTAALVAASFALETGYWAGIGVLFSSMPISITYLIGAAIVWMPAMAFFIVAALVVFGIDVFFRKFLAFVKRKYIIAFWLIVMIFLIMWALDPDISMGWTMIALNLAFAIVFLQTLAREGLFGVILEDMRMKFHGAIRISVFALLVMLALMFYGFLSAQITDAKVIVGKVIAGGVSDATIWTKNERCYDAYLLRHVGGYAFFYDAKNVTSVLSLPDTAIEQISVEYNMDWTSFPYLDNSVPIGDKNVSCDKPGGVDETATDGESGGKDNI